MAVWEFNRGEWTEAYVFLRLLGDGRIYGASADLVKDELTYIDIINIIRDEPDKCLTDFTPITNIKGEVNRDGIRKMTPREWARLQGFPEKFKIVVADASAYKQFGNSVAIPAIKATAEKELKLLGVI